MAKPPPKVPDKADDKEQSERFIETARELQTDETGRALEEAFNRISQKPEKQKICDPQRNS
jgi:hypothetical protein